ncbi:CRISPR-associated protein Cas1 [Ureibacillus massiliensis 4400831 = CIP 108448 = CCUG 49529]|uniref:CRISPR-associated endonuclease Cas1 n=1 Tax=Ureibacillus massiliensis 4400831 = CIP 108448 = CCUG 49529 TaxID=1211035 RepID=A0A0A3JB52_9BACL|nr:type I-B CRISPR-associated endonuclease Cas1b [Ureibacillus massiliensis]KGR92398.1 CRISPR-associated protein Cas1 [Ureibacillus massiliensis 4400831 = CIP 108448 = CCUG 49529]
MQSDIFVFSNGRLQRKDNTLYILAEDGRKRPVPIEQIENVHLFGQIDLNSSLLNFVGQKEVILHFYNYYGFYTGSFYPREQKVSGIVTVKQSEHYLIKEKRLYLAQNFVKSAAFHMIRTCRKRKNIDSESVKEIMKLDKEIDKTKNVQQTMGIEGMIRQHYYKALNEMIPQEFIFEERSKRPPRDPFNALISFGNTMMYTAVLSEIYKTHLNPTISYLHEPSQKRFSLCLDLAEIFKPMLVDPLLLTLVNTKKIQLKHFDDHEGMIHLNEEGRKIFITAFDERLQSTIRHRKLNRNVSYRYLIRLECYKLIKHVIGDTKYIPLKAWW